MLPDDYNNGTATANAGHANIVGQGFHTDKSRINTAGRAKGTKNRATVLRELAELVIEGKDLSGVNAKLTVETVVMQALVKKAMEGDVPAIREVQDTLHGKLADKTELTGANGEPLNQPLDQVAFDHYVRMRAVQLTATQPKESSPDGQSATSE